MLTARLRQRDNCSVSATVNSLVFGLCPISEGSLTQVNCAIGATNCVPHLGGRETMKRIIALGSVAVGALALAGIASVQIVPPQFVVSGKDAEKIQDFTRAGLSQRRH